MKKWVDRIGVPAASSAGPGTSRKLAETWHSRRPSCTPTRTHHQHWPFTQSAAEARDSHPASQLFHCSDCCLHSQCRRREAGTLTSSCPPLWASLVGSFLDRWPRTKADSMALVPPPTLTFSCQYPPPFPKGQLQCHPSHGQTRWAGRHCVREEQPNGSQCYSTANPGPLCKRHQPTTFRLTIREKLTQGARAAQRQSISQKVREGGSQQ